MLNTVFSKLAEDPAAFSHQKKNRTTHQKYIEKIYNYYYKNWRIRHKDTRVVIYIYIYIYIVEKGHKTRFSESVETASSIAFVHFNVQLVAIENLTNIDIFLTFYVFCVFSAFTRL